LKKVIKKKKVEEKRKVILDQKKLDKINAEKNKIKSEMA